MADLKISELGAIAAVASADVLPIVDTSLSETNKVSVEDLLRSAPAGTAAAPSIAFVDDPDTGFYRSAANELSISTGGTQRVVVDSAGKVGIGTSSPAGTLNVLGTGAAPSLTYDTANLVNLDQGSVQLAMGIDPSAPFGAYLQGRDNTNGSRIISLNPMGGRVGIGTRNPGKDLHISSSAGGIRLQDSDLTNTYVDIFQSGSAAYLDTRADTNTGQTIFRQWNGASQSEVMRIDSAGRVGIGTDSPGAKLEVSEASPTDGILATFRNSTNLVSERAGIRFEQSNTSQLRCDLLATRMGSNAGVDFSIELANSSGGNQERFRITETGNVGIGTTSPDAILHANAGAANIAGLFESTDGIAFIGIKDSNSTTTYGNKIVTVGDNLYFDTAGTGEKMRIDAAGNVGIGTSNPFYKLHVSGTGVDLGRIQSTDNSNVYLQFQGSTTTQAPQVGAIGDNAVFRTAFTERMRIRSNGVINFANCPTYADDTAAGTGGLVAGDVYKTSTGELRIKL